MKLKQRITSVAAAMMLFATMLPTGSGTAAAANGAVKIMPLGDSITFGMGDDGGYRKYLDYFLDQKGFTNVDFVGPEGSDSASFTYQGKTVTYDDNHAGYSGYAIMDQSGGWFGGLHGILETMQGGDYIRTYSPDIILLQIGTNDVTFGYLDGSEERLHTLLDYLLANMPANGAIFFTTIPDMGDTGWGSSNANIASYNEIVKKVANEYAGKGKNVIFADIHSTIDASTDLGDSVHPNAKGYEKMGRYWAEILTPYLNGETPSVPEPIIIPDGPVIGDLDGDDAVTAKDLTMLKQGIRAEDTSKSFKTYGDVNESGAVNALDAGMMSEYLTGKVKRFEKGEYDGPEITGPTEYPRSYDFKPVSQLQANKAIPDPFIFADGSQVKSQEDWWRRQAEIRCMYEYYMYGVWRDGSDDEVSYSIKGNSMKITVKRKSTGKTASFNTVISLPGSVRHEGGAPVILGMHKSISEGTATQNGYAVITYDCDGVFSAPGTAADNNQHVGAFYDLYPYGRSWEEQTGDLLAWSWGISKILDALYAGAAKELNINPDSSIVTGVSRYGKATAVCGAFERRIKMCAPSCSGAGGLALYRYKSEGKTYDFSSKGGSSRYTYDSNEPLGSLQASGEQGWFNGRFMEFRSEDQFPVDQHMLASLCCDPNRYLFMICSCQNENWVNAPSQWMAYLGAKHVFDYMDLSDHIAINVHLQGHAVIEEDVKYMVQYFDQMVYGIPSKTDLSVLQTSVFALPQNKDPFADTFASNWLY